jgi:predicted methyltransferase
MKCVITDIIRDFSLYPMNYGSINYEKFVTRLKFPVKRNPGIKWYKSTLFRFEALGKPKPVIAAEDRIRIKYVDWKEDITYPMLY